MNNIKVAIVHDWLTGMRGGEKCLEVFCELFPDATVFTLLHKKGSVSKSIESMEIKTSFLQNIPGIHDKYRNFLPLFPAAIESFDLSKYDLVLSSSHCVAKGVKKKKEALHVCHCYTPVRYVWKFFDEYFSRENPVKRKIIKYIAERIKKWDLQTNKDVDYFIAISEYIKDRIAECYDRDSYVIYSPIDTEKCIAVDLEYGDFYLVVSALVPYKRIDLAVEAFKENGKRLVVIGKGSDTDHLKAISSDNITFLDWVDDDELKEYYSKCRALIFPGEEDLGLVPIEAQAYGKPVIAYGAGGALETVIPLDPGDENTNGNATGIFFNEQTKESLNDAIKVFESNRRKFDPDKVRKNALRFNRAKFKKEIRDYVSDKWYENKGTDLGI